MQDSLVALGTAAGVTKSITLGTSILLLPLRRTATFASKAASIKYIADRELRPGAGYVTDESEAVGVDMKERGPRLSEGIEVLQGLFRRVLLRRTGPFLRGHQDRPGDREPAESSRQWEFDPGE